MSRQYFIIWNAEMRRRALQAITDAPKEARVEIKDPKRTLPQNSRFWAMLTDVSRQFEHCGRKYEPDQWKTLFLSAFGREMQFAPSLDGRGFVPLGQSSSDLSVAEMGDLMTFMEAWGAENGIVWSEPKDRAPAPPPVGELAGMEREGGPTPLPHSRAKS